MLEICHGTVQYDHEVLLDHIDLRITCGDLNCIIGPNGAGKTSLLKIFAQTLTLSQGTFKSHFVKPVLIPQYIDVPAGMTVYDYVSSILYRSPWKWFLSSHEKATIQDILKKLGLLSKCDRYINELSAGEIHLANIGLALVYGADLIMLDEPTAHLDLVNQVMVCELLKDLTTKDYTVIVVMHDINMALKYCNQFLVVLKDKTLFTGNKTDLIEKDVLKKSFGIDFTAVRNNETILVCPDI